MTRVFKGSKRAVCLFARAQDRTVCVNWDTGETVFGERADPTSPWKIHASPPLEQGAEPAATGTEPRSGAMIERRAALAGPA
ncbi:hypothetical protein [Roseiarcus fermentans]|uniref:hypothetical protein n=1 Tax=Roseiarcus fermentans TaxID=1473586 RepID=UPI000DEBE282|nr:hypothetical protein [Roseiarcus fermentans]